MAKKETSEEKLLLKQIRFNNIEDTVLRTEITNILQNNELSTKEKVDSLIESIEIEAESEKINELEELTDELEEKIDTMRDSITELENEVKTLKEDNKRLQYIIENK